MVFAPTFHSTGHPVSWVNCKHKIIVPSQTPSNLILIIPRKVHSNSHGVVRNFLHSIFQTTFSLEDSFGVSHLSSYKIASPLPLHFRFLNSAPGSISKPVIGSFGGWPAVECLSVLVYIHLGTDPSWNSLFITKLIYASYFKTTASEKWSLISKPPPTLCCHNLHLETRVLSKLFWKVLWKVSVKPSGSSSLTPPPPPPQLSSLSLTLEFEVCPQIIFPSCS